MADPREFVLIGRFDDGITPELAKINNQLASLKQSFSNIGGKGARAASRDIGRFKGAVESLNETLKVQNKVLRSTIEPMRQYRREVGKTVNALKKLDEVGGRSIAIERTNKALAEQIRLMDQLRSRSGRGGGGGGGYVRPPRGGDGGGPRPSRGGGGGGGGGGGYNFHMGAFAFGMQMGQGFSQPVTSAIMSGFQIGIGLMRAPFEYFAKNLGERMEDELSDLKAAGGLYSISQRQQGEKFVKTFDQAIEFTQANNKIMAKLAASLPGDTQDYIEVGKRISDGIARTVMKDTAGAIKLAESIRAADARTYGAKQIEGQGAGAQRQAMQVLMGEITKQTVLAGIGGGGGGGRAKGAYGLPQLTERMISDQEISVGKMQKYAAIFGDPAIQDALARNVEKINATSNNSAQRMQAILAMYKEIVTPELVERYRRSMSGIMETFNTAIFGKETGVFGLGRKMQGLGKKFNEFGQMIDWYGKVTTDVTKQANESLAIYDLFRDIVGNIGQVLAPIVENLTLLWDPLRQLGLDLGKAREFTYKLLHSFNVYKQGFEDFANTLPKMEKDMIMATKDLRASLLTIGNLFAHFGVYSQKQYDELVAKLKDPKADLGKILSGMIDTFFDSEVAKKVGEFFGKLIGTVLTEVAKVTGFISKRLSGGMLSGGFFSAFEAAGGTQAISNIMGDVFATLFNLAKDIIPKLPLNVGMLLTAMVVIPAVVAGLFMSLAQWMTQALQKAFGMVLGNCQKMNLPAKAAAQMGAGCNVTGGGGGVTTSGGRTVSRGRGERGGLAGAFTTRRQAAYARLMRRRAAVSAAPTVQGAKTLGAFGKDSFKGLTMALGASKFGKAMTKVAKFIPGGAVAAGVLDAGIRMISGQGAGQALGGAGAAMGGSAIGAMIGSVIAPGIGTAIGGIAGGLLGDYAFQKLSPLIANLWPWADKQKSAADTQLTAAQEQMAAAKKNLANIGAADVGAGIAGVTDPGKLMKVIEMMGLSGDKQAQTLLQQSGNVQLLTTRTTEAGNLLNSKIQELRRLKYTDAQIASQGDIKALQANFNRLQENTKKAAIDLNKTFAAMPQATSRGIATAMQKIDTKTIEYAIANKINMMAPPKIQWNNIAPGAPTPGGPSPIFTPPSPKKGGWALGNPFGSAKGSLGDAIASEMRMKPPGSDLVIANSSETVIPAAGGYGMKSFIDTLAAGFSAVKQSFQIVGEGVKQSDQNSQKRDQQTNTKITDYHNQTQSQILKLTQNLSQLSTQVSTMSSMGGMMGGGGMALGGGYGGAGVQIAGQLGNFIKQTGGAPGSIHEHPMHGGVKGRHAPGSYHYSGRAIDIGAYANEQAGVIARIKQFNAQMGVKPVEFLHAGNDPNHQDHVHVAYALGKGNPAFFSSQSAAERWEASMAGRMNVRTVTGNTSEGFGGSSVGDIYVTVNAGATNDPDQLAYMVAERIQRAVGDAVNANILV